MTFGKPVHCAGFFFTNSLLIVFFLIYNKYIEERKMANELPLSKSEITHYTNYWCKSKGISAKDLEIHPQADDVVLLVNIREAAWHMYNSKEQGVWSAYWGWVYSKKFPLKKKHLKKLQAVTEAALQRHKLKQQAGEKIRQMRVRHLTTIVNKPPVHNKG